MSNELIVSIYSEMITIVEDAVVVVVVRRENDSHHKLMFCSIVLFVCNADDEVYDSKGNHCCCCAQIDENWVVLVERIRRLRNHCFLRDHRDCSRLHRLPDRRLVVADGGD